jgi:membrane-bound lytic murein transglycosylase D
MKHGTRDFYQLSKNKHLPSETINYVPKVMAAMHIVTNADKYGFSIPRKKQKIFEHTHLSPMQKDLPLSVVAKRLNLSTELLAKLNPELKRQRTPKYFSGTYYLRIPQNNYAYQTYEENSLTSLPLPKTKRPGSRRELNRRTVFVENGNSRNALNDHKQNIKTMTGPKLRLASYKVPEKKTLRPTSTKIKITNRPVIYKIRRGDNLTEIAKLFDVKLSKIKKVNKLNRGKVIVGQKIVLPDTRRGIYTVKKGDHLTKVAREFKRPIEVLVKLNSLKRGEIYPGQKIIVNMD